MRAHEGVPAARRDGHAQPRLEPGRAFLERARRDDQVIEPDVQDIVMPSSAMTFFTAGRDSTRSTRAV